MKEIKKEILMLELLEKRIQKEKRIIDDRLVTSALACKENHGYFEYYVDGKYVSKRKKGELLRSLARSEYWNKLAPVLRNELRVLKRALHTKENMSDVYRHMYKGKRLLFVPDYAPIELKTREFEMEQYEGLGFREDDSAFILTNKGERVRSKSEKIIGDELARLGIPYKYEKPLKLNIEGTIKEIYPDFTVMNITTGEIKYLEHLGMMDNPQYYKNTLSKLDIYERNGLLIGRDVILLHESYYHPLNTKVVTEYIKEFLT